MQSGKARLSLSALKHLSALKRPSPFGLVVPPTSELEKTGAGITLRRCIFLSSTQWRSLVLWAQ